VTLQTFFCTPAVPSGTALPDIQQLPSIIIFLGIDITAILSEVVSDLV
jgi:hypothetical protein